MVRECVFFLRQWVLHVEYSICMQIVCVPVSVCVQRMHRLLYVVVIANVPISKSYKVRMYS